MFVYYDRLIEVKSLFTSRKKRKDNRNPISENVFIFYQKDIYMILDVS